MRYLLTIIYTCLSTLFLQAQNSKDIIAALRAINKTVVGKSCNTDSTAAISNRAMTIFLADKAGYLSGCNDLSFFTNYATFNTDEGKFTVRHSFQPAAGADDPISHLFNTGVSMNIASSFAKSFTDKRYENELGATASYTWLGKVKTRFANCELLPVNQKQSMDALRAAYLKQIETEITRKEAEFRNGLQEIDSSILPGQNPNTARLVMEKDFYNDLKTTAEAAFASMQAATLIKTGNYKLISTQWTSIAAYAPLVFPKYAVVESLTASFQNKHSYPLNLTLSHTRLWESSKTGRIFFTLSGAVLFNNSKLIYGLDKLSLNEYSGLGGTDATHITSSNYDRVYIGRYETFLTPSLAASVHYFPADSHIGISLLAEQNFGQYNSLNGRLSIPVILINSKKTPAVDIECYLLLFDISNKSAYTSRHGKTSLGMSIGIPFSRLMY